MVLNKCPWLTNYVNKLHLPIRVHMNQKNVHRDYSDFDLFFRDFEFPLQLTTCISFAFTTLYMLSVSASLQFCPIIRVFRFSGRPFYYSILLLFHFSDYFFPYRFCAEDFSEMAGSIQLKFSDFMSFYLKFVPAIPFWKIHFRSQVIALWSKFRRPPCLW